MTLGAAYGGGWRHAGIGLAVALKPAEKEGQRGDIGPNARGSGVKLDGFSKICWQLMDRAVRDFLTGHTFKACLFRPTR